MTSFPIALDFDPDWPSDAKIAALDAAAKWSRVITEPLTAMDVDGRSIAGVLIKLSMGQGAVGGKLAKASLLKVRPKKVARGAGLPLIAEIKFDFHDYKVVRRDKDGRLYSVLLHEIGHCLGIGSLWRTRNLIKRVGTKTIVYDGHNAKIEYAKLRQGPVIPLPVAGVWGMKSSGAHWKETVFGNELMSSHLPNANNVLSRLTIASLKDLKYKVNFSEAEPYLLPGQKSETKIRKRNHPRHKDFRQPGIEIVSGGIVT